MASTILKYPLKAPVEGDYLDSEDAPTGRTDYLRIQRFRTNYAQSQNGYGGDNLPNNNVSTTLSSNIAYLNIPPGLTTSYQADYDQIDMGTLGVAAAGIAAGISGGGGNIWTLTVQDNYGSA